MPQTCKWRRGANTQSDSARRVGAVGLDVCTVCLEPALCSRDRSPLLLTGLSLSSFLSFLSPLSLSLSFQPLSLPSVSDLGTGSGERQVRSGRGISAGRQGGREGEKGRKSTQVWFTGLSSGWDQALHLEVGGAGKTQSQSGSAEQEELPGDFHTARRH